jgi:hypothetical protein
MNSRVSMLPDILTAGGTYFNFEHPAQSVITPADIAHGLSHVCRFGGHCRTFYSVAQHCVLASGLLAPFGLGFEGLMHDAAEAYVGDMPAPLKRILPEYKALERRVEAAIFDRFDIDSPLSPKVKEIDLVLLATEQRDLMPDHDDEWALIEGVPQLTDRIVPWSAEAARAEWLARFEELRG